MKQRMKLAAALVLLFAVGAAAAPERTEIHFPNPSGYHTLKCDFHMHTVFSDGTVWPTVRVDEAWREGLDAIAITDHIEYVPHKVDLPANYNRSYELAAGKARKYGLLLVRGAEITRDTPPGHFNAIFLNDIDPLDTADFYEVFKQAQQQRAFVFWNHPDWKGAELGRWGEAQAQLLKDGGLHGIEICNGDGHQVQAHHSALKHNLTLLGNSDIHSPSLGIPRTPERHRTLTLVLAREKTVPALHEALVAHRTVVWFHNQLIGRERELAALFAACVEIDAPHHHSGDTAWVRVRNLSELDIELEHIGKGQPPHVLLPARATSLVRFNNVAKQSAEGVEYKALNFLLGPDKPLTVRLEIPRGDEQPSS